MRWRTFSWFSIIATVHRVHCRSARYMTCTGPPTGITESCPIHDPHVHRRLEPHSKVPWWCTAALELAARARTSLLTGAISFPEEPWCSLSCPDYHCCIHSDLSDLGRLHIGLRGTFCNFSGHPHPSPIMTARVASWMQQTLRSDRLRWTSTRSSQSCARSVHSWCRRTRSTSSVTCACETDSRPCETGKIAPACPRRCGSISTKRN